ncbi:hypothetical protein IEO21_03150 [Rhodonia placenta]|uniref:SNF2 N-terminal domain-containing protein n=1 Tax=Rhodonia placenta TaxID=104341 RepID=A0A8H7U3R1_9APHY|nr:hypothetical protein IEO21_03150 [Postia placenta]
MSSIRTEILLNSQDIPLSLGRFHRPRQPEIYSDLPSPKGSEGYTINHIQGMRSSLYNYQQESVSAMLARELSPTSVNDPLYISIKGVDGTAFYLQPSTMELRRECPQVIQSRGGILCEELGTGKTVMMLSLILATLDQLPQPEESIFDLHPIMTPLSFRYFSTAECNTARERLSHGSLSRQRKSMSERRETLRVPSLVEILLHHCRAYPEKLDLHMYQEDLEQRNLWEPLRLCTPFYHQYDLAMPELVHTRRNYTDPGPRKMYLSSATIVVVPVNLFQQWRNEIMKHCYDTLRVLEIKTDTVFPRAVDLASDYDTGSTNVTPLLQVRWKRLVIDEGHISASIVTNLTPFAKMLSVERKWIITGTPTTNLLGLQFGTSSEVQYPGPPRTEGSPASDYIGGAEAIELNAVARKWTPDDREDLRKLSNMIIHFLEVPQFATGTKTAFDEAVIQPLMGDPRPRPGAIEVLEQVMSSVMIRHRIADVEEDVLLPLMHQETILLDLDQYAVKSYNALQASIVINAVDSERTDQDYLFHPSLRVMFWHVDDEKRYNVDEMVKSSNEFLQNARRRNVSPQDILLLEQAIAHVKSAGNDLLWRAMQSNAFVFHRIHDVSSGVYEAWSPLPIRVSHGCVHVLTSERLIKLRSFVMQHPLASISQITAAGLDFEREEELRRYERERSRRDARGQSNASRKEREVARQIVAPEKREEVQREFVAAQKRLLAHFQDEEQEPFAEVHPQPVTPSWLLSQSPLAGIRMGNSTSSKLDFILDEVLQHSPTEKFLIFSSSPLTLGFVAEGLELVQVKFIQYTTAVKPELREQLVTTFETSDLYRVFLMELKHGARGLYGFALICSSQTADLIRLDTRNLVSASRIIFCEPVWQADVEIQAIK